MNTSHSLTSHYLIGNDLWTWRGFDLFGVSCIECYSSCNVWEVWKLGCYEWWVVGGIYSPNHQTSRLVKADVAWRNEQSGAPPDTVRCACHVTWSLDSDRWSFCLLGHWTDRWCTRQALFTVRCAIWLCSDSGTHCSAFNAFWRRPLARSSRCSASTPDSPVHHRTVRWIIAERPPEFPKVSSSELEYLVHRTVRCARPGHTSADFCSQYLNPFPVFLLVCYEPLAPVELIIYSKLVSPIICVGQFNHQNQLGKGVSLFPFQTPPFWWLMPTQTKANIGVHNWTSLHNVSAKDTKNWINKFS
jgi:hypothetical protein